MNSFMKWISIIIILFGLGQAQSFQEQLSYQTPNYVFKQDSSLVAAVNRGSISIFDTSTQDLVTRLEPRIPLCTSALFYKESLFALCGHMLYQWDLITTKLLLGKEINRPYIEYEDFIFRRDTIIDVYKPNASETPYDGRSAIVLQEFLCCDSGSDLRIWSIDGSQPDYEVGISEIHRAVFQDWQLLEVQSLTKDGLKIYVSNMMHGEISPLEPSFVVADELYYVDLQMENWLVLLKAFQPDTKETHNWLFDLKTRKETTWVDDNSYVLSEEAKWLARKQDKFVSIWEARAFLSNSEEKMHLEFQHPVKNILFSKDESHLLVETIANINLFKLGQSEPVLDIPLESPTQLSLSLSPNAQYLFIAEPRQTRFIDVQNQSEMIRTKATALELRGYWQGYAEQHNSELAWQTNLFLTTESHTVGAAVAYVNYEPSYACTSKLLYQDFQDGLMSLKEELITGQDICVDKGTVTLEQKEDGLQWYYYAPDGSLDSSALLTRP